MARIIKIINFKVNIKLLKWSKFFKKLKKLRKTKYFPFIKFEIKKTPRNEKFGKSKSAF